MVRKHGSLIIIIIIMVYSNFDLFNIGCWHWVYYIMFFHWFEWLIEWVLTQSRFSHEAFCFNQWIGIKKGIKQIQGREWVLTDSNMISIKR